MIKKTTKRYKVLTVNSLDNLRVKDSDLYQFGCEFEFYIDTEKYNFQDTVEYIKDDIACFSNKNLLSSWLPRSGYSQNVMDILSKNTKAKSREIKNKKGTIWNLEKVDVSHIEIKAIGGVGYHKEIDKIMSEFDMYVKYFDDILNDINKKYREKLISEHKQLIQSIDKSTKEEFSKAVSEAGLIE